MLVDARVLAAGFCEAIGDSGHGVKPLTGFAGGVVHAKYSATVSR